MTTASPVMPGTCHLFICVDDLIQKNKCWNRFDPWIVCERNFARFTLTHNPETTNIYWFESHLSVLENRLMNTKNCVRKWTSLLCAKSNQRSCICRHVPVLHTSVQLFYVYFVLKMFALVVKTSWNKMK